MRAIFLCTCLSQFLPILIHAQINCSVNAGVDANYCIGIQERFELFGGASGSFDLNTTEWSIVEQPPGANLSIDNPNSLNTQTSLFDVAGRYVFRLSLECELGTAFQDVTYTLAEEPIGELSFPILDCIPVTTLIEVKKNIAPGSHFQYGFLNQGILQIHSETDSTLILQHGIGRCFDVREAELVYGVANDDGCVIQKTATFKVPFYYERDPFQVSQFDNACLAFNADCTVGGDVLWEIVEAPPGSDAYFINDDTNPGILCDIIDGCYTIRFELSRTACNDTTQYFRFCDKSDFGVFMERRDLAYCEFPEALNLSVNTPNLPHICTEWKQIDGPPGLKFTIINNGSLLIEGLLSSQYYVIQFEEINKLNNCKRIIEFHLSETPSDLEDNLELNSFWTTCSGACVNQVRLDAGIDSYLTDVGVSNVNMFISLINWPGEYDFEESIRMDYSYGDLCDNFSNSISLSFDGEQLTNVRSFDFLPLSRACGLEFILCDAQVSGTYSFRVQFMSDCFNESYIIDLFHFKNISSTAINGGTDQILPCGQDSSSLVGSAATIGSSSFPGFWQFIELPAGASNPIQGSINTRVLKLENLIPGLYRFVYNSGLSQAFASCNTDISSDTVQVLVSDGAALQFDNIQDEVFCLTEEIRIELPFNGPNVIVSQIDGPSIDFELVDDYLLLDNGTIGDFSFEYFLGNDCEEYRDTINVSILSAPLEQAIIITQDSCHRSPDSILTVMLIAEPVSIGTGSWSYFSSNGDVPNFPPNYINQNQITVEFKNTGYTEFYWTTTNDDCSGIDIDTVRFNYAQFLTDIPDLPAFISDCNTSFPDTIYLDSQIDDPQIELLWGIFSFSGNAAPQIISPMETSTAIIFEEPGEYILFLYSKSNSDCAGFIIADNYNYININLSESGSPAFAGDDQEICIGVTQLDANTPELGDGFWTIISYQPADMVVELSDFNDPNASISLDRPGTISLSWNITGLDPDCGISSIDEIVINYLEFEIDNNVLELCGVENFIFSHAPIQSGTLIFKQIEGPSLLEIRTIADESTLIENIIEGEYLIEYNYFGENSNCEVLDTIRISNVMEPNANFNFQNNLCVEDIAPGTMFPIEFIAPGFKLDSFNIEMTPSGNPSGNSPIINQDTTAFQFDNFDEQGEYLFSYVISRNGCLFQGNFVYIIDRPANIDMIPQDYVSCPDAPLQLNGFVADGLFYNWSPPDLVNDPLIADPTFIGNTDTTLTLSISNTADFSTCLVETTIDIKLNENIDLDLPQSLGLCFPETVLLEVNNIYDVAWYLNNPSSAPISTDNILELDLDQASTIYYEVTSAANCTVFDSILVTGSTIESSINPEFSSCYNESLTLQLINPFLNYSYEWKDPNGNVIGTSISQEINNAISGVYTVCISTNDGFCQTTLSTQVIFYDLPMIDLPDSLNVCFPELLNFEIPISDEYIVEWSLDENFGVNVESGFNFEYFSSSATVIYYRLTGNSNCTRSDSIIINGSTLNETLDSEIIICDIINPITINLENANDNNIYSWKDPNGNVISDEQSPQISNPVHGIYTVCISSAEGQCTDTLSVNLMLSTLITNDDIDLPNAINLCFPDSVFLNIDPDFKYDVIWSFDPTLNEIASDQNQINLLATQDSILYYRIVDSLGCQLTGNISIFGSSLQGVIEASHEICSLGDQLLLEVFGEADDNQYQWKNPNGDILEPGASISISQITEGRYMLCRSSNDSNCMDTLYTEVSFSPLINGIVASANPNVIFEGEESILNLDLETDPSCTINWTPSESLNNPNDPNPIAKPIVTTTYTATIMKGACTTTDTVTIIVRDLCEFAEAVFVPNLFTPNGDGANDVFRIEGYFDDFEMIIFNRWGHKVASLDFDNNAWDGSHQNEMLPVDVYGYDMTILHCDGEEEKRKGSITLLR